MVNTARRVAILTASVSVWAALGCATVPALRDSPTPSGTMLFPSPSNTSSAQRIARAELTSTHQASLENVLRQLRPEWFRAPSSVRQVGDQAVASVFLDDVFLGAPDLLRLIPVDVVTDVRYYTPFAARSLFGFRCLCSAGAILVSTRTPRE
jgi:hypothetical protein